CPAVDELIQAVFSPCPDAPFPVFQQSEDCALRKSVARAEALDRPLLNAAEPVPRTNPDGSIARLGQAFDGVIGQPVGARQPPFATVTDLHQTARCPDPHTPVSRTKQRPN